MARKRGSKRERKRKEEKEDEKKRKTGHCVNFNEKFVSVHFSIFFFHVLL